MTRLVITLAPLLAACSGDAMTKAPYKIGLHWVGTENVTIEVTEFKHVEGDGAEPSIGSVGAAEDCDDAAAAAGTYKSVGKLVRTGDSKVIGNTVTHHPLKPGEDTFNQIGVSIVASQTVETGTAQEDKTFFIPGADQDEYEESTNADAGKQTSAAYHGIAADEYVVDIWPLDLWQEWDPTNNEADDDRAARDEYEQPEGGNRTFSLLTRNNPKPGDIWTGLNGTTIYKYMGTEAVDVGGKSVKADKVLVYENANFDANAGNVLETCLKAGVLEFNTTQDDVDSFETTVASLDEGCAGQFVNQQVGTEWWYGNVLVKWSGKRVFVNINDYGFEWYVDEDDFCTRESSTTQDDEDGERFVQYTVTVETSEYTVGTWEILADDAGAAAE